MSEFRNGTHHEFVDISSEEYREYVFPNNEIIRIENPLDINVTFSGHRIFDAKENSYYVPKGWICVRWKTKEGRSHFVM